MELVGMAGRKICLIGEGMVELRNEADGTCRIGYGGDTLNTAIHMARHGCDLAYATALGEDTFSTQLHAAWSAEGLDCSAILTDPERGAGLYAITLDTAGERSFTYWRSDSAARQLFAMPGSSALAQAIRETGALAFSLISLAILPEKGREALVALARSVREADGLVAFDGNYRPRLWEDAATAARWRDRAIAASGCPHGASRSRTRYRRLGLCSRSRRNRRPSDRRRGIAARPSARLPRFRRCRLRRRPPGCCGCPRTGL